MDTCNLDNLVRDTIVFLGHIDHGKSTLIGRLLYDNNLVDHNKIEYVRKASEVNSRKFEFAYLLDALDEERENNITIDIARCYAKIEDREYLFIDAPGHLEFLKNMMSGVTRADLAVVVLDVNQGISANTFSHFLVLTFLGFKDIFVCINKMDCVSYDREVFYQLMESCNKLAQELGISISKFIPISAYYGENVASVSEKMDWFKGDSFLDSIKNYTKSKELIEKDFRMYVQNVYTSKTNRIENVLGRVYSGTLKVGDDIQVLPSNSKLKVLNLKNSNGEDFAKTGDSISIIFDQKKEFKRGDLIFKEEIFSPSFTQSIEVKILWLGNLTLTKGVNCRLKIGTNDVEATVKNICEVFDLKLQEFNSSNDINEFQIAKCNMELKEPLPFDVFSNIGIKANLAIRIGQEIQGAGIILK